MISKTTEFDPVNGKLLRGPVIFKVDSGPGRIVASEESISKREAFLEMGLFILVGLPMQQVSNKKWMHFMHHPNHQS